MTMPPDVPLPEPGDTSWSDWAEEQEAASDALRVGGVGGGVQINVKSAPYNAAGNGSTNDTTAIQSALDAANAAGGGTVYLPPGTYMVSGLTMRSNIQLIGSGWGSKLRLINGSNAYVVTMAHTNPGFTCEGSSVRYMVIECNGGGQTAESGGVKWQFTARTVIDHVLFSEPYHAAIATGANPTNGWPFENTITNCLFTLGMNSPIAATAGMALDLIDAEENWIHSNAFEFNGAYHIRENVVGNNSIHNNTFVEGKIGIFSDGSRGRWTGNIFDRVGGPCFRIAGQENMVANNAAFDIGQGQTAGANSIVALDWEATRNIIAGNIFISHGTAGQTRSAVQEMFNNAVDNLITNNQFVTRGTWGSGAIETQNTSDIYRGNVGAADLTAASVPVTLTYAATIATNAQLGSLFRVTLTGNATLGTPTNPTDGQKVMWQVTASGANRTLTLATGGFKFGTDITSVPVIASGTTTYIGAIYNSAAARWHVIAVAAGY